MCYEKELKELETEFQEAEEEANKVCEGSDSAINRGKRLLFLLQFFP